MAYLLAGDLDTHIYASNRDEITRGDNTIVYEAIDAAVSEAKSYLSRFDLVKIFGNGDTEPQYINPGLKQKVKDLAHWHLVTLANPNIAIDIARMKYEDAIRWFEKIGERKLNPGFPMPANDPATDSNESESIEWNSEAKRQNHY